MTGRNLATPILGILEPFGLHLAPQILTLGILRVHLGPFGRLGAPMGASWGTLGHPVGHLRPPFGEFREIGRLEGALYRGHIGFRLLDSVSGTWAIYQGHIRGSLSGTYQGPSIRFRLRYISQGFNPGTMGNLDSQCDQL